MQIGQSRWTENEGLVPASIQRIGSPANLVFVFGSTHLIRRKDIVQSVRKLYPDATLFECSTAGDICDTHIFDNSLVITAIKLEHTRIESSQIKIKKSTDSFQAGENLALALNNDGLKHVFVLSDGLTINVSDLVKGLTAHLPESVTVT